MRGATEVAARDAPVTVPASRGVAVVIGLALLGVLTLLALASVRSARVERGSAARTIAARSAFEAAERGLSAALAAPTPPATARDLTGAVDGGDGSSSRFRLEFDRARAPVEPPSGFSLGAGTGFSGYPFIASAVGTAGGRSVRLRQDIVVIGAADD
jgi:hypothetical protein